MNEVKLHGRLVNDPDIRYTQNGTAVAKFTVATEKKGLSKEKKEELRSQGKPTANFPRCVVWGKQAETIANYFKKGDGILLNGEIETGSFKNNAGETVYTTIVKVDNFEFPLGSSTKGGGGSNSGDDFSFGSYNPDDFQAIDDDTKDIPF